MERKKESESHKSKYFFLFVDKMINRERVI